ncbi:acyl-CoA dehydrogenase family protein [Nocardioides yefusunii]|uniref:Acyl-CoA dehydrogenase family protein n=1 Tax=Nocardioides yefusunii TaxID=2500546 RepID=A0ABW1QW75_9ACTN|nr:acyl-CoA dehydrogenase family protein [Nocardioides yefusunii]
MDFAFTPRTVELAEKITAFMEEHVYPAETVYDAQVAEGDFHEQPQIMKDLQAEARRQGLWNFAMTHDNLGAGLTNLEYAPLAEIMGRSIIGNEVFNCSAPDTGNMEILAMYGTEEQKNQWLKPLLDCSIRSAFAMTEPWVASSDAMNVESSIVRDGDEYVINGRKWFTSGGMDPDCKLLIFMGKSDPDAEPYRQQSMILVPTDAPGVEIVRDLSSFGYRDRLGHAELQFTDVRVPAANMLGNEGDGFAIAQGRLGPGRMHYAMRAIGIAERGLQLMCERAQQRSAFGGPLADQGVVREWIARSRMEIDQIRLYTFKAAWLMDTQGNAAARTEVAAIKVAAMEVAHKVIDRAVQTWGAAGTTEDTPLARFHSLTRALQIADGPTEVHLRSIGRGELRKYRHLRPEKK